MKNLLKYVSLPRNLFFLHFGQQYLAEMYPASASDPPCHEALLSASVSLSYLCLLEQKVKCRSSLGQFRTHVSGASWSYDKVIPLN